MGFLSGVTFDNVFGFISNIGQIGKDLREALTGKTITDPAKMQDLANKAAEIQIQAAEVANQLSLAQIEINKVEAASSSKFIAGWRPFIGWVGGSSLVWIIFIHPIWLWLSGLLHFTPPPEIAVGVVVPVIGGMLGIGIGGRTYEKSKGVQNNH